MDGYHNTSHSRPGQARQPQLRRLRCAAPVGSTGAAVLYRHTQQDTSINSRHEVDRLGAAGSASNESRSIDHLQVMNSLVGAQWRRRTHRGRCMYRARHAIRPGVERVHAHGSAGCTRHTPDVRRRRGRSVPSPRVLAILSSVPRTEISDRVSKPARIGLPVGPEHRNVPYTS